MISSRFAGRLACALGAGALVVGLAGIGRAGAVSSATGGGGGGGGGVTNPYSPAYGHPYRHGVIPTRSQQAAMNSYAATHFATTTSTGPKTLGYDGGTSNTDGTVVGVTSGTPKVYLVFWGTQWGTETTLSNGDLSFSNDPYGGAQYIQNLFKGLGTGSEQWSGTMTQYCDGAVTRGATSCPSGASLIGYPTGGAFGGVWYDTTNPDPSVSTSTQLAQEAVNAAKNFGNITPASNRYAQYVILSPKGLDPDSYKQNRFCAWHDYTGDAYPISNPYGYLAFTNMPYVMDLGTSCGMNFVNSGTAGYLDGYSIVGGHEYAETITDQFPAGGWSNLQSNSYSGEENGDECAWISPGTSGGAANVVMGNGHYAMQSTWSNDTNTCEISHPIITSTSGSGGGTTDVVTVTNPGNQTGHLRTFLSLQIQATDSAPGQSLTYSATNLPPGLSINSGSGLISGTPTHTGNYSVNVTATDGTGASGSAGFNWAIKR
ncbi:MAG TPA: Ig domain-containing protein [Acidimicrobiales bacterium]|nr:Ig domain-containing protein [Acidimicrobiales bacterium]